MPHIASIGTSPPGWTTQLRRVTRGVPVRPRNPVGLDRLVVAAAVDRDGAVRPHQGGSRQLSTTGASSGLFALAVPAESDSIGPLVTVEQASLSSDVAVAGGR